MCVCVCVCVGPGRGYLFVMVYCCTYSVYTVLGGGNKEWIPCNYGTCGAFGRLECPALIMIFKLTHPVGYMLGGTVVCTV